MTTRRDFLKIAAISGTALVVPFHWAEAQDKTAEPFKPNAWVRIDPDGKIFLTVGKSEMGQGVRTSLPMILAEELDADWKKINLVQASPGPDFTRLWTGGSFSVSGSWKPLRTAGAAARAMLLGAAAARWSVPVSDLRTEAGMVRHSASGRSASYAELVADAAALPVPADPPLKKVTEFRLIGQPLKRIDGPSIVDGSAQFGTDVKVPGMRYASVVRCPVLGGRVKSFDSERALKVPGVRRVILISTGLAIVADNTWAAMQGREALDVVWDEGPYASFSSRTHLEVLDKATAQAGVLMRKDGEGLAALPKAAKRIEAKYVYPFYAHAPLETMNCTASVRDGACEIWVPTQAPNAVQTRVAELLKIEPAKVKVNVTLIGGGFGRRLHWDYALEAAELSAQLKEPVQILWTRSDDMKFGYFQAASVHLMQAGIDAENKPVVWGHKKVSSYHNARSRPTAEQKLDPEFNRGSAWGVYDVPYLVPAMEMSYVAVDTHVPIGPWRAVFSPSSTFARECFLDEIAHATERDPLQFRLDLLGEPFVFKAGGLTLDRSRMARVLELVRQKSGWDTPLPRGRGRGVACNIYDAETHVAFVAEVTARPDKTIRVDRVVCAIDCGVIINPLGIESQVESGVIWSLSSVLKDEITFAKGHVEQSSFGDFDVLRIDETPPRIETYLIPSHGEQPWGMGEPTVPPMVPALVNAIFSATGKRLRRIPIRASDLA